MLNKYCFVFCLPVVLLLLTIAPFSNGQGKLIKFKWGTFYLLIANFFDTQNIGGA